MIWDRKAADLSEALSDEPHELDHVQLKHYLLQGVVDSLQDYDYDELKVTTRE